MRDKLKEKDPDRKLTIIADNMIFVHELYDPIKWDDEERVLYVLKHNEDHRDPRPVKVQAISYDMIQFLEIDMHRNDCMETILDCGFDEAEAKAFIEKVGTIKL